MKRTRLQDALIAAEAVRGDLLCLKLPGGGKSYVAVLQVQGLAFDLRDQAEQDRLIEGYRALLAALDVPMQQPRFGPKPPGFNSNPVGVAFPPGGDASPEQPREPEGAGVVSARAESAPHPV